jgi:hypothetical protein
MDEPRPIAKRPLPPMVLDAGANPWDGIRLATNTLLLVMLVLFGLFLTCAGWL